MQITIAKTLSIPCWEMFSEIDPLLSELFFSCCSYLRSRGVNEIIITSIIRPYIEGKDSGIHSLNRAIDFSDKTIPRNIGEDLQDFINLSFPYDKTRPRLETLVYHEGSGYNGIAALHYHLQVKEFA